MSTYRWKWLQSRAGRQYLENKLAEREVGEKIDVRSIDRLKQFAQYMYDMAKPGQWSAINELLSKRMAGESESASKIKGQILQAQMSEEMSKRIANSMGSSQSAALALIAARPVAGKSAAAVEHSAMQRRIEQGQATNTFANASQKQEGFRADLLKMGLSDAQAKLAADIQTRKNLFRDVLRERARQQITNQATFAGQTAALGFAGGALTTLGTIGRGSQDEAKKKQSYDDQGILDVKKEEDIIKYGEGEEERWDTDFNWA